jgi:hypothetical protein
MLPELVDEPAILVAPIPVASDHDWLEHVWGWSQTAGLVLAGFAVLFAVLSWLASKRAAGTADDALRLARDELNLLQAEAARKPRLRLNLSPIEAPFAGSDAVQVGLGNDGDLDAYRTVVTVIVPAGSRLWYHRNPTFSGETALDVHPTPDESVADDAVCATFEQDIRRQISAITYVRVVSHEPGDVEMRVKLTHPDAAEVSESVTLTPS